ncbi:DUF6488 family protein [Hahella sp. CR1]|uniref:DUF6488 family protein n=1 Tax=unclassified Hahella TaxID=2624107 RepID=UPI0024430AD5|nr:DUF6488 family protein [Hahella sp. CR1]MDG9670988.1 DUF6488 family protein [Hahella sp. CR1]
MTKTKALLLSLPLAFSALQAHAHPNHDRLQAIPEETAQDRGDFVMKKMVGAKRLDASWTHAERVETLYMDKGEEHLWRVSYKNSSAADAVKQTFFIFLDDNGNYVTSNYTGQP